MKANSSSLLDSTIASLLKLWIHFLKNVVTIAVPLERFYNFSLARGRMDSHKYTELMCKHLFVDDCQTYRTIIFNRLHGYRLFCVGYCLYVNVS